MTITRALLGPILLLGGTVVMTNAAGYYGERGRLLEMEDAERAEAAAQSVDALEKLPLGWKIYKLGLAGAYLADLQYDTRNAVSDVTNQ